MALDSFVVLYVSSFIWATVCLKCGFCGNSEPLKQEVFGLKKCRYKNKVHTEKTCSVLRFSVLILGYGTSVQQLVNML